VTGVETGRDRADEQFPRHAVSALPAASHEGDEPVTLLVAMSRELSAGGRRGVHDAARENARDSRRGDDRGRFAERSDSARAGLLSPYPPLERVSLGPEVEDAGR
jgi:hypothetical protein